MDPQREENRTEPGLASRIEKIGQLLGDSDDEVFVQGRVHLSLQRGVDLAGNLKVLLIRAEEGKGASVFVFYPSLNKVAATDNGFAGSQYDFDELLSSLARNQRPAPGDEADDVRMDILLHLYGQTCARQGISMFDRKEAPSAPDDPLRLEEPN